MYVANLLIRDSSWLGMLMMTGTRSFHILGIDPFPYVAAMVVLDGICMTIKRGDEM